MLPFSVLDLTNLNFKKKRKKEMREGGGKGGRKMKALKILLESECRLLILTPSASTLGCFRASGLALRTPAVNGSF